jgi:anti-anti-sigma regulatory factor
MDYIVPTSQDGPTCPDYRHILVDEIGGVLVVRFIDLERDLDSFDTLQEIGQELESLVDQNHSCSLIVDFEGKDFIPLRYAFFLGKLVRLFKEVKRVQGTLKICDLPPSLVEIFKTSQLIQILPPYKSLDDALTSEMPGSDKDSAGKKPQILSGSGELSSAPSLQNIVRKSALLNLVIVLTSFPVLVFAGGMKAVVPALAIMAGITLLIWTATFALFSFVSLPRIFRTPLSSLTLRDSARTAEQAGVSNPWLDGSG